MKKLLLTGATGFLGGYILACLKGQYEITTLGRNPVSGIPFISYDFSSGKPLIIKDVFDVVVHVAGKAHMVPKDEEEKAQFYQINLEGTKALLHALEESNNVPQTFIFISTIAVYGKLDGENINEEAPLLADDPYGRSKILAEQEIKAWSKVNEVNYNILRLPLVAGLNPPGNLGAMIQGIESGRYARIGKGNARKSMVFAEDVAKIIPGLIDKSGTYNLTDGYHPTFRELEDLIASELNKKIKIIPWGMAKLLALAGDVIYWVTKMNFPLNSARLKKIIATLTFNDDKARHDLGWYPDQILEHPEKFISK